MEQSNNYMTTAQRKASLISSLRSKASQVDREGLDLFEMEEKVPYLFRLGRIYDYQTKAGETGRVAEVVEVTTGISGEVWLGKTRLSNIFAEFEIRTKEAPKGQIALLELTDNGIEEVPSVKGGKARAYKRVFMTIDEKELGSFFA